LDFTRIELYYGFSNSCTRAFNRCANKSDDPLFLCLSLDSFANYKSPYICYNFRNRLAWLPLTYSGQTGRFTRSECGSPARPFRDHRIFRVILFSNVRPRWATSYILFMTAASSFLARSKWSIDFPEFLADKFSAFNQESFETREAKSRISRKNVKLAAYCVKLLINRLLNERFIHEVESSVHLYLDLHLWYVFILKYFTFLFQRTRDVILFHYIWSIYYFQRWRRSGEWTNGSFDLYYITFSI